MLSCTIQPVKVITIGIKQHVHTKEFGLIFPLSLLQFFVTKATKSSNRPIIGTRLNDISSISTVQRRWF